VAPIPAEILDQIVRDGPLTAEEIHTPSQLFKKALIERALGRELTHHLGSPPGAAKPALSTNHRNGTSGKTVLTDDGPVAIEVPRDRAGTFEPQLIGKHERRFTGFDDKVVALYARGLTREIQAFLKESYGVEVSPDLISAVTDAVVEEVTAWQMRPLDPMYPWCSPTRCASKFATTRASAARRSTRRWRCCPPRRPLAMALRPVCRAASADAAATAIDAFARGPWGATFPTVVASWRRAWTHVIPSSPFRRPCAA
jgi:transposase-like protein